MWGHAVGDQILSIVAARLSNSSEHAIEIIRFGGDEFVAYANIPDITLESATQIATSMIERIGVPIRISGKTYEVSATVGVTVSVPESTPESLLLEAHNPWLGHRLRPQPQPLHATCSRTPERTGIR